MFRCFFLIAIILIPDFAFAYTDADVQKISLSKQWLKLLHYRKSFIHKFKSEEDSQIFFFDRHGKFSPYGEIVADLKELQFPNSSDINLQFQCRFPARYNFLKKSLNLPDVNTACPMLDEWLKTIGGESVTLISANSYPQNPISTFGHTFLRINSSRQSELQILDNSSQSDLLDYSIGFAADSPPGITGISYIFKGIFGGFNGHFSVTPYYLKTKEYNNLESRDIWEYQLNLSKSETHFLLLHLWELGNYSSFDYYFFDENCSYQILTLLDVTREDLDLTSEFPYYTPPIETVKVIANKYKLVTQIKFRPSLFTKMKSLEAQLSEENKKELKSMMLDEQMIIASKNPNTLEAIIAYYSYLKQKESRFFNKDDDKKYFSALKARSFFPSAEKNESAFFTETNSPHNGHDTSLISLTLGSRYNQVYNDFKFSGGYHDFMTNEIGYPEYSKYDLLSFTIRNLYKDKNHNNKIKISEITPLEIISLIPYNDIDHSLSWSGHLKYENSFQRQTNSSDYKIGGAIGLSKAVDEKISTVLYFLAGPEVIYAPSAKVIGNLNSQIGIITSPKEDFKINATYNFNYNVFNRDYKIYQVPGFMASWNIKKNIDLLAGLDLFYYGDSSHVKTDYKFQFRIFL